MDDAEQRITTYGRIKWETMSPDARKSGLRQQPREVYETEASGTVNLVDILQAGSMKTPTPANITIGVGNALWRINCDSRDKAEYGDTNKGYSLTLNSPCGCV